MSKKLSNELKQQIKEYYLQKPTSIKEVAKHFNLCSVTVGKILKNIPKYTKTQLFSPELIENWFETIDNEEKAYYLGLFITDGNICKSNNRQINCNITLHQNDKYILEKFLQLIKSNKKLSYDGRSCYQAAILSNKMAEDLKQYGVIPNKTLYTYLPTIPNNLMPHLLRGILDGDGSIIAHWHTAKDGRTRFKHEISFCGTHKLMYDINEFLHNHLNLNIYREIYDYKNKNLSELKITNYNDIQIVGNYLYNNATIYMTRKKEKYNLIIERINNMTTLC